MEPANAAQNSAVETLLTPEQRQQMQAAGVATGLIAALIQSFVRALLENLPNLIGSVPAAPTRPAAGGRR